MHHLEQKRDDTIKKGKAGPTDKNRERRRVRGRKEDRAGKEKSSRVGDREREEDKQRGKEGGEGEKKRS